MQSDCTSMTRTLQIFQSSFLLCPTVDVIYSFWSCSLSHRVRLLSPYSCCRLKNFLEQSFGVTLCKCCRMEWHQEMVRQCVCQSCTTCLSLFLLSANMNMYCMFYLLSCEKKSQLILSFFCQGLRLWSLPFELNWVFQLQRHTVFNFTQRRWADSSEETGWTGFIT